MSIQDDDPRDATGRTQDPSGISTSLAVLKRLHEEGFVDGLVRRIDASFNLLERDAVEDVVADSMAVLYDALETGRTVRSPEGFVFKTARYLAQREHERVTRLERDHDFGSRDADDDDADEPSRDVLRAEAVRVARRLLPRLGQTNVIRVMTMIIDAVEAELTDISSTDIAAALQLSPEVARKSRQRGFERLERIAAEEGLTLSLSSAVELEDREQNDEEERDDDEH